MQPPIRLWGIDAAVAPLPGGHRHAVWRTFGLQRNLVFKTTARSEAAIGWLTGIFDHAEASGFAVPRPLRSLRGALVEQGWMAEPLLPGAAGTGGGTSGLQTQVRAFHVATAQTPQRPGIRSARALCVEDTGGDIDLAAMPAALAAACRAAWARLPATETVVHGDLGPANILWDHGRPGLVDWDEARVDSPLFDLAALDPDRLTADEARAVTAWEIACCWQIEPVRARALAQPFVAGDATGWNAGRSRSDRG